MVPDLYRRRRRRQALRRLPSLPPEPQGHLEIAFNVPTIAYMSPKPCKPILREVPVEPTWLDLFLGGPTYVLDC